MRRGAALVRDVDDVVPVSCLNMAPDMWMLVPLPLEA